MTRAQETEAKLGQLRQWMEAEAFSAVVLNNRSNFAWLTAGGDSHVVSGFEPGICSTVITTGGQFVLTDNIEAVRLAEEELAGLPFELVYDNWHDRDDLVHLRTLAQGRIASDTGWPAEAENRAEDISRLQWALLPVEQERYRHAGRESNRCLAETCRELEPGMSEYQIAGRLAGKVLAAGLDPLVVLVAVDERIYRYRHPIPTAQRLEQQAMVVVGARYRGLVVSATRLVHFGPPSAELADKHRAVCTVDACLNLETRPGAAVKDLFAQAVDTYAALGYPDEWRLHHQGGGTGYGPRTYKGGLQCPETVLEGQAFAWNPSITGTKSEDTILAWPAGPEFLSAPTEWPLLDVEHNGVKIARPDLLVR